MIPIRKEITELLADVKEQVLYLQELGVSTWEGEMPLIPNSGFRIPDSKPINKFVTAELVKIPLKNPVKQIDMGTSRLSALPSLSRRNTERPTESRSDNIEQRKIKMPKAKAEKTDETFFGDIGQTLHSVGETIDNIRADIGNCVRCPLHQGRTQIVHTKGNFQADLMFVGEAPGADEDAKGEPFVGRAGQLLTKIIESIGMRREDVVIGNINRCRPPSNRQPTLPEAETCKPFLLREIAVIRPKVIVVMGNTALHNLLETKTGISKIRGEFHDYFGVKVMPTFHPAYLLRDPRKKREVWEDMKKVRDFLKM
ncbi:MAG: uracil-DNA glycosylase [Pyrinomonadaceae bacterium]